MNSIPLQKKNSSLGRSFLVISFCVCAANLFGQTTNLVSLTTFESDGRPRYSYPYHYTYGGPDPGGSIESFNTFYYDPNDTGLTNAMKPLLTDILKELERSKKGHEDAIDEVNNAFLKCEEKLKKLGK